MKLTAATAMPPHCPAAMPVQTITIWTPQLAMQALADMVADAMRPLAPALSRSTLSRSILRNRR